MGAVYGFECLCCGYKKTLSIGIGFLYPVIYNRVRQQVYQGYYGEEMRLFLKENPYRVIIAENELYVCEDCGELSARDVLGMYKPIDETEESIKKINKASMDARKPKMVLSNELKGKYIKYKDYDHRCDICNGKMIMIPRKEYDTVRCPKCKNVMEWDSGTVWD